MTKMCLSIILILLLLVVINPIVISNEPETELEFVDIYVQNNFLAPDELKFTVKNIGDIPIVRFTCKIVIERLLFGIISIRTIYNEIDTFHLGSSPLMSGEKENFIIVNQPDIILPGFYMVHLYLESINEFPKTRHCTNLYEKFLSIGFIFQNWIQCY